MKNYFQSATSIIVVLLSFLAIIEAFNKNLSSSAGTLYFVTSNRTDMLIFLTNEKDLTPFQTPTLIQVVGLFPIFVTRLEHWISGVLILSEASSTALEGHLFVFSIFAVFGVYLIQ